MIDIIHNCTREYVYPVERNKLHIKVSAAKRDGYKYYIVLWNNLKKETKKQQVEMVCYARDKEWDYYICGVELDESVKYLRYYIVLDDGVKKNYYTTYGVQNREPAEGFFEYHYTNENDVFKIPQWTENAVMYQVFPERFYNGDKTNDPNNVEHWGEKPTRENYFGGDIAGIYSKLDYLDELGIDAIYLTPIFEATSNHKYDTTDYLKIDKSFGTLDEFKQLVEKIHELNMKIVLDGVFNHCGYYFEPFQDVLKNQTNSKYKDWFYISEFPIETEPLSYECVGYYKWMPKLRHKTKAVREYILNTGEYWIKEADIDGWRLDVSDELDFTLRQEFRRRIKSINEEAVLIGETWTDGRDLLRGDEMDSVMNYLFRDAVVGFVAKGEIDAIEFDNRIGRMLAIYPRNVYNGLYNMLGSHDTDRFLTLCGENIKKLKLAVVFQMTFPGMPAIYYGDEVGITGENDPDCRKTMEWENQNLEVLDHFKDMIKLRKSNISLQMGEFKPVVCQNDVYGFVRDYGDEYIYIIINNSPESKTVKIPLLSAHKADTYKSLIEDKAYLINTQQDGRFYNDDIYSYEDYLELKLEAYGFEIIKK